MLGAIAGDIIGSRFEWNRIKSKDFPLFTGESTFTDDTILTIAIAEALMTDKDYASALRRFGNAYSGRGYGGFFSKWLGDPSAGPYGSYGNGAAMRVSPVAYAHDDLGQIHGEAERCAAVTHNHPEGIKGAQAAASAIFLARKGKSKDEMRRYIHDQFGYNLDRSLDIIRENYTFDETCQGTVPEAIISFLESDSFEGAIRNAISLGGDSDTLACITGGIAEAYYGGVPDEITEKCMARLPQELREVVMRFKRATQCGQNYSRLHGVVARIKKLCYSNNVLSKK